MRVTPPVKQVVFPDGVVPAADDVVPSESRRRGKRPNRKRSGREGSRQGNVQQPAENPANVGTPTKKVNRKRHHQKSPQARGLVATPTPEKQVVNKDDFPSLGGGGGDQATKPKSDTNKFGYAQALLKSSRDDTLELTEQMRSTGISMEKGDSTFD
jgi:hypothetical protein